MKMKLLSSALSLALGLALFAPQTGAAALPVAVAGQPLPSLDRKSVV